MLGTWHPCNCMCTKWALVLTTSYMRQTLTFENDMFRWDCSPFRELPERQEGGNKIGRIPGRRWSHLYLCPTWSPSAWHLVLLLVALPFSAPLPAWFQASWNVFLRGPSFPILMTHRSLGMISCLASVTWMPIGLTNFVARVQSLIVLAANQIHTTISLNSNMKSQASWPYF